MYHQLGKGWVESVATRTSGDSAHCPRVTADALGSFARAGVPSEADRWSSNQSFIGTRSWPETQALIGKVMEQGLPVEGDFERRLGHHVGHAAR